MSELILKNIYKNWSKYAINNYYYGVLTPCQTMCQTIYRLTKMFVVMIVHLLINHEIENLTIACRNETYFLTHHLLIWGSGSQWSD